MTLNMSDVRLQTWNHTVGLTEEEEQAANHCGCSELQRDAFIYMSKEAARLRFDSFFHRNSSSGVINAYI